MAQQAVEEVSRDGGGVVPEQLERISLAVKGRALPHKLDGVARECVLGDIL